MGHYFLVAYFYCLYPLLLFLPSASANNVTTITLGQNTDYPPYAYQTEDGQLTGFAKDFADGLTALCDDLEVIVVKEEWSNCWSDSEDSNGGSLGASVANGVLDGCMTYTHTKERDAAAEFSDAILNDHHAAGLITLLDSDGIPHISGMDNLAGKIIIDVGGWSPSAEAMALVENKCTYQPYSTNVTIVIANDEEGEKGAVANDVAMRMLRNGEGDAIFIRSDHGQRFSQCLEGEAGWNCTLWEGFGTEYAYVQSGQFGYSVNGTTLALSQKESGIREVLRPCMVEYIKTKEYYDICEKHDLLRDCLKNDYVQNWHMKNFFGGIEENKGIVPTSEQTGDCSDGYCPCVVTVQEAGDENALDSNGNDGTVVTGHYFACQFFVILAVSILNV